MNWLSHSVDGQAESRRVRIPFSRLGGDCLLAVGIFCGVRLFCGVGAETRTALTAMLATEGVAPSFSAAISALGSGLLFPLLLCVTAFLTGLSPCGVIVSWVLPVLYGAAAGLTLAQLYSAGWHGVFWALLIVLPRVLCMRRALDGCCGECRRMSQLFLAQLRPASAHCGGLQLEFRAYCARFLTSGVFALASAIWDVLMRMICSRWL